MAALLTSVRDDKDKSALYLHECRRMGVKVLPPDVNSSNADFSPVGTDIRYGLAGIRNVGTNVVASICATRKSKGAYAGFADFLAKVEPVVCNKKVIESLIKAGAFDSLGHTRQGLLRVHAEAVDACLDTKRAEAVGQFDLFSSAESATDEPTAGAEMAPSLGIELDIPRDRVGQDDPARLRARDARPLRLRPSAARHRARHRGRGRLPDRRRCPARTALTASIVTVGGILSTVTRKMTKRGDSWATATLEDLEGAIEVLFFPNCYQVCAVHLAEDAVLLVARAAGQARGRAAADRAGRERSGCQRGPARPGGDHAARQPVHAAGGGAAQGGAGDPSRHHRGAAAAHLGWALHGAAPRRPAAGQPRRRGHGRYQGAAGAGLSLWLNAR